MHAHNQGVHNFMERKAEVARKTQETVIEVKLNIDGRGETEINTGIPFFDHMLTLFGVHGFFDLYIYAKGDIDVDLHHTVEDVGLVLGDAWDRALGNRKGIKRYGHAVTPMDESLCAVTTDLSKRPYLVYHLPGPGTCAGNPFIPLGKEFFRAFSTRGGMNLHINVHYGENEHHIMESVFKAAARSLDMAAQLDPRLSGVLSTKGAL